MHRKEKVNRKDHSIAIQTGYDNFKEFMSTKAIEDLVKACHRTKNGLPTLKNACAILRDGEKVKPFDTVCFKKYCKKELGVSFTTLKGKSSSDLVVLLKKRDNRNGNLTEDSLCGDIKINHRSNTPAINLMKIKDEDYKNFKEFMSTKTIEDLFKACRRTKNNDTTTLESACDVLRNGKGVELSDAACLKKYCEKELGVTFTHLKRKSSSKLVDLLQEKGFSDQHGCLTENSQFRDIKINNKINNQSITPTIRPESEEETNQNNKLSDDYTNVEPPYKKQKITSTAVNTWPNIPWTKEIGGNNSFYQPAGLHQGLFGHNTPTTVSSVEESQALNQQDSSVYSESYSNTNPVVLTDGNLSPTTFSPLSQQNGSDSNSEEDSYNLPSDKYDDGLTENNLTVYQIFRQLKK